MIVVFKCDLFVEVIMELWVLMMFNEEVQKVFEDALLKQKLTESILKVARPARSTE